MAAIYKIDFDFTSQSQNQILRELQSGNYKLMGYKGATGTNQVTAGLPTWFVEPYNNMFGQVEIDYEPRYKVYVFNQANIGANITIQMQALSTEVPLGTSVTFNEDGSFSTTPNAPVGSISVFNNRPGGTNNLTIGLASKINGQYAPFCAFTCRPLGSIIMTPNDKIVLFASQTDAISGTVIGNASNCGCTFEFSPSNNQYALEMIPNTFCITNTPSGRPVIEIASGTSLAQLLNTP